MMNWVVGAYCIRPKIHSRAGVLHTPLQEQNYIFDLNIGKCCKKYDTFNKVDISVRLSVVEAL
ncbi:hypothetical protein CGC49_07770 [Capnocytophaga sp. H4358]|uniref:hypothetical protein n=1 Tax=Capnocytophaga canis TaxID=1848903 RepID=UPI000BB1EE9B|nr:hypothetical protein CGC49_07770 [Capnocytophaga sp. H4358]